MKNQVGPAERQAGPEPVIVVQDWGVTGFCVLAGGGEAGAGGATTPIEMMYFSASSTDIVKGWTSARGTISMKPEVGFGVVGT